MADIKSKLFEYKEYIILAGFIVGVLHILDFLPERVSTFGLDENVRFVYIGIIGLSVYCFHSFFWKQGSSSSPAPNFQRTAPERNLSDPKVRKDLINQRGTAHMARPPVVPQNTQQTSQVKPSQEIFDAFKKG